MPKTAIRCRLNVHVCYNTPTSDYKSVIARVGIL